MAHRAKNKHISENNGAKNVIVWQRYQQQLSGAGGSYQRQAWRAAISTAGKTIRHRKRRRIARSINRSANQEERIKSLNGGISRKKIIKSA